MSEGVTEGTVVPGPADPGTTVDLTPADPTPDPADPANWPPGSYIEDDGVRFRVAESVGFWPLAMYAKVASDGVDSETLDGFVAIFDLMRDLLHPDDFHRFGEHVSRRKYKGDKILEIMADAMSVVSARPSESPPASPGGAATTSPNSNGTSTPPASSPPTRVVPLDEIPEAEREAYMASLSPVQRRQALGIFPVGDG
jgi:hypothetical protein